MPITSRDWSKQKARTLSGESVTKAMAGHDRATEQLFKSNPITLENMSAYLGANKSLEAAIDQTIGKCKPRIHDETKAYLQSLKVEVKAANKEIKAMQAAFATQLKAFQTKRTDAVTVLQGVLKNSLPGNVKKARDSISDLQTFLNQAMKRGFNSAEITRGMKAISASLAALDEIEKMHKTSAAGSSRPQPLTPDQLKGPLGDLAVLVKNLNTIGGFYPPPAVLDKSKAIIF